MRIIVDAMGGDNAPKEIINGILSAVSKTDDTFIVVGNKSDVLRYIKDHSAINKQIEIVHTEQIIAMDDDPLTAIQKKKDSSMVVALKLLADGKGDALVSAGNTGALFSGATLIVKRASGIKRAAIGTLLPSAKPCLLLDAGANVSVTEEYLEQFALIGSSYMQTMYGIKNPKVGILNNGTEECKGMALQIEAGKRLRANESINFIGNVEASAVMADVCDVVVCDGFTGNIFLKASEGMGKQILSALKDVYSETMITKLSYILVQKKIRKIKKRFDATEHGGSPFLGISKPVIKAHGSSNAIAFENAIYQAKRYAESKMCFHNTKIEL
ncbi:MAG: phosphate acyltransferase PlsX [Eubacteriales bacterium]|nr:phosphate acyltransferase PlsX [Eubacteriales bacterium]